MVFKQRLADLQEAVGPKSKPDPVAVTKPQIFIHLSEPLDSRGTISASNSSSVINEDYDSDAEYDDDLDYVEPKPPKPGPLDPERTRQEYRAACQEVGTIPCSSFLRSVSRSRVVVGHSGLCPLDIKCIAISLLSDIIVHELHLQDNRMGPEGMQYLAECLQSNRNVKVLDVSDNMLGRTGAKILAEVIKENDALLSLRAAGNKFNSRAGMFIGEALRLDLSRNEFADEGGVCLADGLGENSSLQGVDLSYNHLRWDSMRAMATAIEDNISIRNLDLSWNGVGLDGCKQIGEALSDNYRLLTLHLRGCRIDAQSLITLIKNMNTNDTLKTIDISQNPLTNSDAILLMKTLIDLPTLAIEHVQMSVSSIMVSKEFLDEVARVRSFKPTFTVAYMGLMGIADKSQNRMDVLDLTGGDPLELLIRYTRAKNLRLVDLFSRLDTDKSCTITRAELVHGVQDAGIPLSIQQMDRLISKVDADGDGEIDFRELLDAYKLFLRKQHKMGQSLAGTTLGVSDTKSKRKTSTITAFEATAAEMATLDMATGAKYRPSRHSAYDQTAAEMEALEKAFSPSLRRSTGGHGQTA
ncbi:hypothetical protein BaRGS_00023744 [Batillaria attramentaria]|uniref:EF-hand domain-containing protein n=1 Tax=Batillaria attramentaria TaxID=370345 RepID=A0ABD0KD18_9CAEN